MHELLLIFISLILFDFIEISNNDVLFLNKFPFIYSKDKLLCIITLLFLLFLFILLSLSILIILLLSFLLLILLLSLIIISFLLFGFSSIELFFLRKGAILVIIKGVRIASLEAFFLYRLN